MTIPKNKVRGWLRSLHEPSSLRFLVWYIVIGVPLAVLCVGLSFFSELQTFNTLKTTGYPVKVNVVSNRTSEGGEDTGYYITYEFTAQDDKSYVREQKVSYVTCNKMAIGTTLDVVYDPSNPTVSRLSNFDEPDMITFGYGLGFYGFCGLFLFLASLLSFFRKRRLQRETYGQNQANAHNDRVWRDDNLYWVKTK